VPTYKGEGETKPKRGENMYIYGWEAMWLQREGKKRFRSIQKNYYLKKGWLGVSSTPGAKGIKSGSNFLKLGLLQKGS